MSDSDLSSLSEAESVEFDDDVRNSAAGRGTIKSYFKAQNEPPPKKKRALSPPHEYVVADNSDIAFIVMFRARFSDAFPKSFPHFGPQDIERGVVDPVPSENVEKLLCALIGLVLNRKKDVERGHYKKPLEEALSTHKHQWPLAWEEQNPLRGDATFHSLTPERRLSLMKALILWSLNSSDAVSALLKDSYKQARHDDDLNQPMSVQPWGRDGDRRRYWLIEGQDDTHFRLYRESNPALKNNTWWSVADSIESVKGVADKLRDENTQAGKRLADRITSAIPRFEAGEEKRKRRDYRLARKAQFRRPDPGFSLYEGRTRGKKIKYTFSDDEETSDAASARRSTRHSGISTPVEPAGPTFTASGRQVKPRQSGAYGETITVTTSGTLAPPSMTNGDAEGDANGAYETRTRAGRGSSNPARPNAGRRRHIDGYNAVDEMDVESDAVSSGNSWDGDDDEDDDEVKAEDVTEDEDDEMSDDNVDAGDTLDTSPKSLVIALRLGKERAASVPAMAAEASRRQSTDPRPPPDVVTNGGPLAPSSPTEQGPGAQPNGSFDSHEGAKPLSPLKEQPAEAVGAEMVVEA